MISQHRKSAEINNDLDDDFNCQCIKKFIRNIDYRTDDARTEVNVSELQRNVAVDSLTGEGRITQSTCCCQYRKIYEQNVNSGPSDRREESRFLLIILISCIPILREKIGHYHSQKRWRH